MPIQKKGRYNYFTGDRAPNYKKEKRIKMPTVPRRPVRFQTRSVIDFDFLTPPPFPGFVIHRKGPAQPWMGISPLEMRAIPHEQLPGTLPERIIYKYLTVQMRFVDGADFNFQSSLQGGRIDTGGIVADFMFEKLHLIINPLGPTHTEFLRIKKDQEQIDALTEMGYQVAMIPEEDVYDEPTFERIMRSVFGWEHIGSGGQSSSEDPTAPEVIMTALFTLEAVL